MFGITSNLKLGNGLPQCQKDASGHHAWQVFAAAASPRFHQCGPYKKKTKKLSNTNVGFLSLVSQVVGFMYVGGCKASCRECRMVKVNEENDTSDLLYHEMTHGHCDFLGGKRWCVKSGRGVRVTHLLLEKSYFCVSFFFKFCRVGFHALDHEFPLGLWGIFRVEISFCSEYVPVCPKWNQFSF